MQNFRYTQDTIDAELKKSKEDFILHFRSAYTDDYPPAWMIAEILPLGLLCRIYTNLKDNVIKKRVAQHFGLQVPVFSSWIVIRWLAQYVLPPLSDMEQGTGDHHHGTTQDKIRLD